MLPVLLRSLVLFAISIATVALGNRPVALAHDDPHHLRGDYAFNATVNCALDFVGFAPNLAHLDGGTTNSVAVAGTFHFNGDGTGSVMQQNLRVNHTSNSAPAIPVEQTPLNCNLTYTVNDDHSFTAQVNCTGTTLAGFGAGSIISFNFQLQGVIGQSGEVLLVSNTIPTVETFSRTTGSGTTTAFNICARNGTAVKR